MRFYKSERFEPKSCERECAAILNTLSARNFVASASARCITFWVYN